MKKNYVLCPGDECPLKSNCVRWCPEMDKTTTEHFSPIPYSSINNKCNWFEKDDILQQLNINSNYEEPRPPYPQKD